MVACSAPSTNTLSSQDCDGLETRHRTILDANQGIKASQRAPMVEMAGWPSFLFGKHRLITELRRAETIGRALFVFQPRIGAKAGKRPSCGT